LERRGTPERARSLSGAREEGGEVEEGGEEEKGPKEGEFFLPMEESCRQEYDKDFATNWGPNLVNIYYFSPFLPPPTSFPFSLFLGVSIFSSVFKKEIGRIFFMFSVFLINFFFFFHLPETFKVFKKEIQIWQKPAKTFKFCLHFTPDIYKDQFYNRCTYSPSPFPLPPPPSPFPLSLPLSSFYVCPLSLPPSSPASLLFVPLTPPFSSFSPLSSSLPLLNFSSAFQFCRNFKKPEKIYFGFSFEIFRKRKISSRQTHGQRKFFFHFNFLRNNYFPSFNKKKSSKKNLS
jgi:hypothetical protein